MLKTISSVNNHLLNEELEADMCFQYDTICSEETNPFIVHVVSPGWVSLECFARSYGISSHVVNILCEFNNLRDASFRHTNLWKKKQYQSQTVRNPI